jgi:hypothetical protein
MERAPKLTWVEAVKRDIIYSFLLYFSFSPCFGFLMIMLGFIYSLPQLVWKKGFNFVGVLCCKDVVLVDLNERLHRSSNGLTRLRWVKCEP